MQVTLEVQHLAHYLLSWKVLGNEFLLSDLAYMVVFAKHAHMSDSGKRKASEVGLLTSLDHQALQNYSMPSLSLSSSWAETIILLLHQSPGHTGVWKGWPRTPCPSFNWSCGMFGAHCWANKRIAALKFQWLLFFAFLKGQRTHSCLWHHGLGASTVDHQLQKDAGAAFHLREDARAATLTLCL